MELTPEQVERFVTAVESLNRAVVGAPKEGNPGLLTRVTNLERRQWLFIAAVFLGSGATSLVPGLIG
jgi:hypothetical protein